MNMHNAATRGCGCSKRSVGDSRRALESAIEEGKNPVGKIPSAQGALQSTAGHEESGGKQGGPPPKAKYYLVTDSGTVP